MLEAVSVVAGVAKSYDAVGGSRLRRTPPPNGWSSEDCLELAKGDPECRAADAPEGDDPPVACP